MWKSCDFMNFFGSFDKKQTTFENWTNERDQLVLIVAENKFKIQDKIIYFQICTLKQAFLVLNIYKSLQLQISFIGGCQFLGTSLAHQFPPFNVLAEVSTKNKSKE